MMNLKVQDLSLAVAPSTILRGALTTWPHGPTSPFNLQKLYIRIFFLSPNRCELQVLRNPD